MDTDGSMRFSRRAALTIPAGLAGAGGATYGSPPARAGTALVVGLFTIVIAARVTADPIISVRHAVSEVAGGDFDVEVPVYDFAR